MRDLRSVQKPASGDELGLQVAGFAEPERFD
jgi:hypothetical protein